jgi:DNA-binding response OmpR family regulator
MAAPDNRTTPWTFVLDEPLRILVADDDPILREFAGVYLATPSVTIDTACDGVAARSRLGEATYDVLLLDIEMPRLDGFSLLEEIRSDERLRHLPVVMLTGHDDIASIDRAYQIGANSFATKPVNWRQLSYQIRYVLRTNRAESLRTGSHDPLRDSSPGPMPAVSERDIRDFLQSVIHRADALERQLSVSDRARFSQQASGVRAFARQALAEYSASVRSSAADCAHRVDVVDRGDAGADDLSPTTRRSVDVPGLPS